MPTALPTYDPTDQGNEPGAGPLRIGGQPAASLNPENDKPSNKSKARDRQESALVLVRDLWAGAERIREQGNTYLPKAPGEDAINYNIRLNRSVFHAFYRRTVEGLTGLIFRKDPVLGEDVPPQIVEQWENIDNAGTHGDVFLRDLTQDGLIAGLAGILVDYPDTGGERLNRAQESGLRPYWVPIKKDDIMSWRTAVIAGRVTLTQLVLRECNILPAGEFGEKEVTQYRQLFVDGAGAVRWRVLYITAQNAVVQLAEGAYPTQVEIPFAEVCTSGRVGILDSDPPLLDVGYLNVAHYQQWSDYAYAIHKSNVPFIFVAGATLEPGEKLVISPNQAITAKDPQASAQYVSHDGASLAASKAALDDLVSTMGTLGLAMLSPSKRVAETADAKRLDKSTSDSALSVLARSVQDAVERALGFHARYLGLPDGGSITINRDFEGLLMDASLMSAYVQLVNAGFPARVVLKALKEGGRIPEDEDLDEIEMEMEAGRIADEERRQQMADLQAQALVARSDGLAV